MGVSGFHEIFLYLIMAGPFLVARNIGDDFIQ